MFISLEAHWFMSDEVAFMKIYKTNENIFFFVFESFFFAFTGIAPEVFDIQGNLSAYRDIKMFS